MCILENVNYEKFGEQDNEKATFDEFFFLHRLNIVIRLNTRRMLSLCQCDNKLFSFV